MPELKVVLGEESTDIRTFVYFLKDKKLYMTIVICIRSLKWIIYLIIIEFTVIQDYFGIYLGALTLESECMHVL
jgi:hypothetical protein